MTTERIVQLLLSNQLQVATAESCTGGMLAAAITDTAGASKVFDRGFVTYSNLSKCQLLDVAENHILRFGAVSEEVARAMANGALRNSDADIAISVTGVAGPGGSISQPVGLVHLVLAIRATNETRHWSPTFPNLGRGEIRRLATDFAVQRLEEYLEAL